MAGCEPMAAREVARRGRGAAPVLDAVGQVLLAMALLGASVPAQGQLLSPGPLSAAHEALEGARQCTRCHELRQRGVADDLCLTCHEPLAERIGAGTGFHGREAASDCGRCHREHFGADFDIAPFDTTAFDHARTGHTLEGAHTELGCRECHRPELIADTLVRSEKGSAGALGATFLGLPGSCETCHAADDPHGSQFDGRRCTSCHGQRSWRGAQGFQHDDAAFRLTGAHRDVACDGCHVREAGGVRYRPVAHDGCAACHRDPHAGRMAGACASCHTTPGWSDVRSGFESAFDHGSTAFALVGRHADLPCGACHDPSARRGPELRLTYHGAAGARYPAPEAASCASCHVDPHAGAFAGGDGATPCASCHGNDGFLPARYDVARHNAEASFHLDGAHAATPCYMCHDPDVSPLERYRIRDTSCRSCHAADDPHGDQFGGRPCATCHVTSDFRTVHVDHDATRFPLTGAHIGVACAACHRATTDAAGRRFTRYSPISPDCVDCHGGGS